MSNEIKKTKYGKILEKSQYISEISSLLGIANKKIQIIKEISCSNISSQLAFEVIENYLKVFYILLSKEQSLGDLNTFLKKPGHDLNRLLSLISNKNLSEESEIDSILKKLINEVQQKINSDDWIGENDTDASTYCMRILEENSYFGFRYGWITKSSVGNITESIFLKDFAFALQDLFYDKNQLG